MTKIVTDLDLQGQKITNAGTHTSNIEYSNGNSTSTLNINWNNGNHQVVTLTSSVVTTTFTNPTGPGWFGLKIIQDVTGNRNIAWPANIRWGRGGQPSLLQSPGDIDIIEFLFDGVEYFGDLVQSTSGWKDNIASLLSAKLAGVNPPVFTAFNPGGVTGLYQYAFAIGETVFITFHVNHDVKPNSDSYFHVHWTTNGTSLATTKWELQYTIAKGHNQAVFPAPITITTEQAAQGTAYRHMVTEFSSPMNIPEADSVIMVRLTRITNGGTNNIDTVFGIFVDIHYQCDRITTKNRNPDFNA